MHKTKAEQEVNMAEIDKRIRGRRPLWTPADLDKLQQGLMKLPDLTDKVEVIALEQPAIGPRPAESEDAGEAAADVTEPSASRGALS